MGDEIDSIPGICDVERIAGAGADPAAPDLVIDIPHGATRAADFERLRRRLRGPLPGDLQAFFFVNTDVGAPECAEAVARQFVGESAPSVLDRLLREETVDRLETSPPRSVWIVRCLVPRTFIDCNRVIDAPAHELHGAGLTQGLPDYVTDPADVALLTAMHRDYTAIATQAIDRACGANGLALLLHTYAPKQVDIVKIDAGIVPALREAYAPGVYETWTDRPDVDVISRATDDVRLAPPAVVEALRDHYAAVGIDVTENASYRLHPGTAGWKHSRRHRGRVVCLEINRALLAEPFTPFEEMTIPARNAERMAAPIAAALLDELLRRRS